MPAIACPVATCNYTTDDVDAATAVALLTLHNHDHVAAPAATNNKQRAPKLNRPRITTRFNDETWNAFTTRWAIFKRGTTLTADERVQHLFQCCEKELGNAILKGHPNAVSGSEEDLLSVVKKLAVIPVAKAPGSACTCSTEEEEEEEKEKKKSVQSS